MSSESPAPDSRRYAASSTPFVFSHHPFTLEAYGTRDVLCHSVQDGLVDAASRVLATAEPGGMVVGALPFDSRSPAHLLVPEDSRRSTHRVPIFGSGGASGGGTARPVPASWRVTERPAREDYRAAVSRALELLAETGSPRLTKVVLARTLELEAPGPIDPLQILTRLLADTRATAYCVPLAPRPDGTPRTLVGASPELLVEKHGAKVTSLPMAGSARRQADAATDRESARALVESAKDQREHRVVVEHVLDTLAPFCAHLRSPDVPVLASTTTMWHLATPIEGDLKRDVSSLELAVALHPTPAVCGAPTHRAREVIAGLEPFDRDYFTGAVGWCDTQGDGRWMVTIRCAEIEDRTARLYAGAGIVAGSDPETETRETSAKFRTLLRALGLDEQGRPLAADTRR